MWTVIFKGKRDKKYQNPIKKPRKITLSPLVSTLFPLQKLTSSLPNFITPTPFGRVFMSKWPISWPKVGVTFYVKINRYGVRVDTELIRSWHGVDTELGGERWEDSTLGSDLFSLPPRKKICPSKENFVTLYLVSEVTFYNI